MVNHILIYIIGSTIVLSLISWVGLLFLFINEKILQKSLYPLISFSAGSLLGGAFFHLLPESINNLGNDMIVYFLVIVGFSVFFLFENILNWHRSKQLEHNNENKIKTSVSYLILVADAIHNFIGGLAIGSSFLISIEVGMITTIAAAAHEIPQEFGDFAILVHGGWERGKALLLNFFSASFIIPAGILTYYLANSINSVLLLPFAAGNFIYIAASDLIPEINHGEAHSLEKKDKLFDETSLVRSLVYFSLFLIGITFIILSRIIFHV